MNVIPFSLSKVISEINSIAYPGGSSDAADALKMASEQAFLSVNGGRADRPQVGFYLIISK